MYRRLTKDLSWKKRTNGPLKPRPNNHNMLTEHVATLLGANMLCTFGHLVETSCDVLGIVGSNLTIFKLAPTTPSMSQHGGQHFASNNVAICCVSMLRSFGQGLTDRLNLIRLKIHGSKNLPAICNCTNNWGIETRQWLMTNFTRVFQLLPSWLNYHVQRIRLMTSSTGIDSEDDFRSGCGDVRTPSPGWSHVHYSNHDWDREAQARFKRRTLHVPNLIPNWVDPNN